MNWRKLPYDHGTIHGFKLDAEGLAKAACGVFYNLRFSKRPKQDEVKVCEQCARKSGGVTLQVSVH